MINLKHPRYDKSPTFLVHSIVVVFVYVTKVHRVVINLVTPCTKTPTEIYNCVIQWTYNCQSLLVLSFFHGCYPYCIVEGCGIPLTNTTKLSYFKNKESKFFSVLLFSFQFNIRIFYDFHYFYLSRIVFYFLFIHYCDII